jgi:hypothetical protein
MDIAPGRVVTNIGCFGFDLDTTHFPQDLKQIEKFVSTDRFTVRGLAAETGMPAWAAPLSPCRRSPKALRLSVQSGHGLSALRFHVAELGKGDGYATLELYSAYDSTHVAFGGTSVPLERDITAQLAYQVDQPYVQSLGFREFLFGTSYIKSGLLPLQPYDPDKIPIVLVHGTFSSPVAWGEMINTLQADPLIARKYQIWNFFYDSGKRIGISAHELRDALSSRCASWTRRVEPRPARMASSVTARAAADQDDGHGYREARCAWPREIPGRTRSVGRDRAMVEKEAVFTHLPFVSRVVFISTPHRGSFLSQTGSDPWFSRY